jgi:hypothetical protein
MPWLKELKIRGAKLLFYRSNPNVGLDKIFTKNQWKKAFF